MIYLNEILMTLVSVGRVQDQANHVLTHFNSWLCLPGKQLSSSTYILYFQGWFCTCKVNVSKCPLGLTTLSQGPKCTFRDQKGKKETVNNQRQYGQFQMLISYSRQFQDFIFKDSSHDIMTLGHQTSKLYKQPNYADIHQS